MKQQLASYLGSTLNLPSGVANSIDVKIDKPLCDGLRMRENENDLDRH